MKRVIALLVVTLALLAISSCGKTGQDEPEDDTIEVNEANLKGTWAYADGVLILTPKEQFASYFQKMNPDYSLGGNTYYDYNEETMEAVQWYVTPQSIIESGVESDTAEGSDWYISRWKNVVLTKTTLTIRINRDTFVLEKK